MNAPLRYGFIAFLFAFPLACERNSSADAQLGRLQTAPLGNAADSVQVTGGMLHYRTAGSGLTVVLLSGGPGMAGDFLEPIYEHLARQHRAVLIDQRGTGRSSRFEDSTAFTLANAVNDIEAVRRQLAVDRVVILGHSWGGALAMTYAAKYPTHVAGLVLVGSAGLHPRTSGAEISRRLRARLTKADVDSIGALSALAADPAHHDSAMKAIRLLNWKAYEYDPANVRVLADHLTPHGFDERTARLMNADFMRHGRDAAAQLDSSRAAKKTPALIMYGEVDQIGLVTVDELRRRFPLAKVEVISRSGHHPWNENPSAFYRAVDEFVGDIPK